jgi:uncharacterized protein YjiS (DUF1127 family)
MNHTIDSHVPCKATGAWGLSAGPGRLFLTSVQTLQSWYERSRQRRRLARLDDRLLCDIGLDRVTAMEEASKPFWRD